MLFALLRSAACVSTLAVPGTIPFDSEQRKCSVFSTLAGVRLMWLYLAAWTNRSQAYFNGGGGVARDDDAWVGERDGRLDSRPMRLPPYVNAHPQYPNGNYQAMIDQTKQ